MKILSRLFAVAPRRLKKAILLLVSHIRLFQGSTDQFFTSMSSNQKLDILVVAPGLREIPTAGWGAVEKIAWQQFAYFRDAGYSVGLLNSSGLRTWLKAFLSFRPKTVICHYDLLAVTVLTLARTIGAKTIGTSHYAYAGFPEKWDLAFSVLWRALSKFDIFIALSPKIEEQAKRDGFSASIKLISNGADSTEIEFSRGVGSGVLFLGKVEPRKRQFELATGSYIGSKILFVGPIADERIGSLAPPLRARFIGEKPRLWVSKNLTQFETLLLASDAEADALVLHEARLAGLRVITTAAAAGSYSEFNAIGVFELKEDFSNLGSLLEERYDEACKLKIREEALRENNLLTAHSKWNRLLQGDT